MANVVKDLGAVTAYGYAVEQGYHGTEEEYAELMASYADVAEQAAASAESAASAAGAATTKAQDAASSASSASASAGIATAKAVEAAESAASASASETNANTAKLAAMAAQEAAETAQGKAEYAQEAAEDVLESIPQDYSELSDDVSELKGAITAVTTDVNRGRVSTNPDFNAILREMYIPGVDLSSVTWVRVYNGLSGIYGFRFYNSSNTLVAAYTFKNELFVSNSIVYDYSTGRMLLIGDLSGITSTSKDYRNLSITNSHLNIEDSPVLYGIAKAYVTRNYCDSKFFSDNIKTTEGTSVTPTITAGKMINKEGVLIDDSTYSIAEFPVSKNHVYKITSLNTGSAFNDITIGVIEQSGNPVSKYFVGYNKIITLYISDVDGTAKICYRNNYTPTIKECDRYDFDGAITKTSYELAHENIPTAGQIMYNADTAAEGGHIVNAIAYKDGVIVAARSNGKVVRIGYDGTETELLSMTGYLFDWRLCWMDSNENVYVSPHATRGSMAMTDRGLYRLEKGESSFTKVISLYDTTSSVETETEENNDTIWTMCEDDGGNLYAGVYAHTTHDNPAIYKSTDGGETWTYLFNFKTAGLTPDGKHIHSVIYSPWQKALYCIVGEVNKIWKSVNGGTTWTDIGVTLPYDKGSSMLALPYGILIGSDGAYNCALNLLYTDDKTYKTVYVGWANTVFAIRRSDETGFIYAFCKIDSSALSQKYYPPYSVLSLSGAEQEAAIQTWRTSDANPVYSKWLAYHDSVKDIFPDDAIIPTHYAILVSRDGGKSFEVLKKFDSPASGPDGFWTTGFATNGEILTGQYISTQGYAYPVVISEGKHKYVSGGCDLSGEIFIRTNPSAIATLL